MNYGIPYMGSKSGIVKSIALNFPKADHFYDMFGGGFAVSHYMLVRKANNYKHFHYNEIKSDVVDLVKRAIDGEFNYNRFKPEWVSRADFFRLKDNDAYIRCCWSFGNNQKDYLFGPDIEEYKRSMLQSVVFDEFNPLSQQVLGFAKWPTNLKTIKSKRLFFRQKIEHYRKTKIPEILKQFLNEKQLERLQQLQQLQQLERLERLQQLQQLERLQQLQRLSMTAKDYRDVEIKPNSVVYCDIPYKGTACYISDFNHAEFYDWAATRDFPVFISEYEIKDPRLKLIYSIDKRSLLSKDKQVGNKSENLYWNGVTNHSKTNQSTPSI